MPFKTNKYYKSKNKSTENADDFHLDSKHTHFLLYDDGSEGILDKNHKFRFKFEKELRKGYRIEDYEENINVIKKDKTPMVLIVFQGGLGTLKSILDALDDEIPVLLIAVRISYFILIILKLFTKFCSNQKAPPIS